MVLTTITLLKIMPRATGLAAQFVGPLNEAMADWKINTRSSVSMFLAQAAHESDELGHLRENLNYSADGLMLVFGKYFWVYSEAVPVCPPGKRPAHEYARQPQRIANWVYANRLGNGDEDSGDGWMYRGGGIFQTTGKKNMSDTSVAICGDADTLLKNPDLLTQPQYACQSAGYFWESRGLNELADRGGFEEVTRKINGGTHGLSSRMNYWNRATEALSY